MIAVARLRAPASESSTALPAEADLSNVVPFARRAPSGDADAPKLELQAGDRPAPPSPPAGEWREWALALAGVVILHAGLYAAFNREPPPQASVGVVSMSVELVLGANEAAGLEKTKGESSVTSRASSGDDQPQQRDQTLPVEKDAGPGEQVIKEARADATGSIANDAKDVIPEAKPAEAKPVEADPVEIKPVVNKPVEETVPRESTPVQSTPRAPVPREVVAVSMPAKPVAAAAPEKPQSTIAAAAPETERAAAPSDESEPVIQADAIEVAKAAGSIEPTNATKATEVKADSTAESKIESKLETKLETKPIAIKPVEEPTATVEPVVQPAETEIEPVEIAAVTPDAVKPVPEPQRQQAVTPRPKPRPAAATVAKPARAAAPASKRQQKAKQATRSRTNDNSSASTPSVAASGVGRGRSAATSNYRGLVSAHLARHKRHSHGNSGTATVAFHLSASGQVTSARLVRGSGVANIDQEAIAMVRRASPFPAPPDGRAISFTVPLRFVVQ